MKTISPLTRLILALLLVALSGCRQTSTTPAGQPPAPLAKPQPAAAKPDSPRVPRKSAQRPINLARCTIVLLMRGEFSRKPDRDVNLINAPVTAHKNVSPPLKVDPAVLTALNARRNSIVNRALAKHRLTVVAGDPGVRPLTAEGGDLHFALAINIGPDNGMGGHASGLSYDVVLTSRHRDPQKIEGRVRQTITARTADAALTQLQKQLEASLLTVFERFKASRTARLARQRQLNPMFILAVKVGNLDAKQQAHVRDALLPCLLRQGWTTSVKDRKSPRGMIRHAVTYRVQQGKTAAQQLQSLAQSFAAAAGRHGKSACSLWQTPLASYRTHAESDGRSITLRWKRYKR